MKILLKLCAVVLLVLGTGCGKKGAGDGGKDGAEVGIAEGVLDADVVSELGFAANVPADSDFYLGAYYDGGKIAEDMLDGGLKSGLLEDEEAGEGGDVRKEIEMAAGYLGDEAFVFGGPGVGDQLKMVGTTYREISAAWGGFVVGVMLDALAEEGKEADFGKLGDGLSTDLMERWVSVLEKDSKLMVPSVVVGWRPAAEQRDECVLKVGEMLDELFREEEGAVAMEFESRGVRMVGYEVLGTEVFAESIEEIREGLEKEAGEFQEIGALSAESVERFLAALEGLRLTMATGVLDGRVLVYFGNGKEGFRLAASPEESLAGKGDLSWMAVPEGKRLVAAGYFSEKMVGAVLPWLDTSDFWDALARAVRAPVEDKVLFRELFSGLAGTARELAVRDVSAWSGAVFSGDGWSLKTRGGIVDPSVDFQTPLKMTRAVDAMEPAFKAHWIQRRDWNELSWKRMEYSGFIFEAIRKELGGVFEAEQSMLPGGVGLMPKLSEAVGGLNRGYRDEFREGVGDEVAFFGDLQGVMPTVPGISQETVENVTVPRFAYARPVVDRGKITESGETFLGVWKDMTAYANEVGGGGIPLILPQSVDSNEMVTWYAPMPFIGGDFVPGVSIDGNVWMVGTSKSLAGGFSEAMKGEAGTGETGVLVEVDFVKLESWLRQIYASGKKEAGGLAGEEAERKMDGTAEGLFEIFSKYEGLRYRKWLDGGEPRSEVEIPLRR